MGSSSSPICFGFGGGLIFFFLAVGSSSSPICSGFGGCLIFDFFFLSVGCGCHIEVVVGGVVVEVDVAGGKVYVMVVLGCRCGLCQ